MIKLVRHAIDNTISVYGAKVNGGRQWLGRVYLPTKGGVDETHFVACPEAGGQHRFQTEAEAVAFLSR